MGKITVLSEDVVNKIAAGEVIERPASVVKELIENSLDASATQIVVILENYGKDLISVKDNGSGMEEEDAQLAVLRHATSKIKSADDLFSIRTLGFRGEALASVAAVSKFSLLTKQQWMVGGYELTVEGGVLLGSQIVAAEAGTLVMVKNLFFNTPARRKFLKSDAVELKHIIEVVTKYALLRPEVSFRLVHHEKELLFTPFTHSWRDTIAAVHGFLLAKELVELSSEKKGMKVTGFVGKPYAVRDDKQYQALFVNGRWVKNDDIVKAIYQGYHAMLFVNKNPIFVVHVQLDPTQIDVNVHPQKLEIKIEQKEEVCSFLTIAVREALRQHNLVPDVDVEFEQQLTLGSNDKAKYSFEPSMQTVLMVREEAALFDSGQHSKMVVEVRKDAKVSGVNFLPAMRLLGQVHKTFFVAEVDGGVVFIDQHAAHERVLYEQFMKQFMQERVAVQYLLENELLELTAGEKEVVLEYLVLFEKMGFCLEHFQGNTFVVKSVPSVFGRLQGKELVRLVLEGLVDKTKMDQVKEMIVTRMACRTAVMAGEALTAVYMECILKELGTVKDPFTCPHGRPTIIKTGVEELEKKFRRK